MEEKEYWKSIGIALMFGGGAMIGTGLFIITKDAVAKDREQAKLCTEIVTGKTVPCPSTPPPFSLK
mgnify:CR=1 FL=1